MNRYSIIFYFFISSLLLCCVHSFLLPSLQSSVLPYANENDRLLPSRNKKGITNLFATVLDPPPKIFDNESAADTSDSTEMNSKENSVGNIGVLARMAKKNEVENLKKMLSDDHPAKTLLHNLEMHNKKREETTDSTSIEPLYPASKVIYHSLKGKKNNIAVVPEYCRNNKFNFLGSIIPPNIYSDVFREAGANAMTVNIDKTSIMTKNKNNDNEYRDPDGKEKDTGGMYLWEDVYKITKFQEKNIDDSPPPLPVIIQDIIIDNIQLCMAHLCNAKGVIIRFGVNNEEKTKELIENTHTLGMEPILQVRSFEEAESAIKMGANVIVFVGLHRDELIENRERIPENIVAGVNLKRPIEFQYDLKEIDDAWLLRDANFDAVFISDIMYKTAYDDIVGPSTVIKCIKSKASTWLVDPTDWINQMTEDGSSETLGDLMM